MSQGDEVFPPRLPKYYPYIIVDNLYFCTIIYQNNKGILMKKSTLNKLLVRGGITASAALVLALITGVFIATYGEPTFDQEKLNQWRYFSQPEAEQAYGIAHRNVVVNGRDSAARTAQYQQLTKEIEKMEQVYDYSDETVQKLYSRRDSIESEVINDLFDKDSAFAVADRHLRYVYGEIEKMRQDSADVAAIKALPLKVRVKSNYNHFRTDMNQALIKYHQHRLNRLEQNLKKIQNEK